MASSLNCASCQRKIDLVGVRFCPFCGNTLETLQDERRSAIVGFGDLSGFTTLGEAVDPDELRELTDWVMSSFIAVVRKNGGVVDKIIGDCIMFVFSSEHASADDHLRVIDTIEEIQVELGKYNRRHGMNLTIHFGVSFGTVSVGRVGTSRTVMGDTVNLAQRLLSTAQNEEILVSESFATLFGAQFRFEKLDPVQMKGKKDPVTAYRYVGRITFAEYASVFVGREKELDQLINSVETASKSRTASSLLLVGSVGIGKTRLASVLNEKLQKSDILLLGMNFEDRVNNVFNLMRRLLEELLKTGLVSDKQLPISMESIQRPEFSERLAFHELEILVTEVFHEVLRIRPVLLVIENFQIADEVSKNAIALLRERLAQEPIVFLALSRINLEGFDQKIELGPLSDLDARTLFVSLVEESKATKPSYLSAVERCNGNPLFIEELARGIAASLPEEKLFSGNLELLLSSILDSFGSEEQELIKMASIFGSSVPSSQLAKLAQKSEAHILEKLEPLQIFSLNPTTQSLVIRTELLRNAAYERINLRTRKTWHDRAAVMLAEIDTTPDVVAHHFLRGRDQKSALEYCIRAARRLSQLPNRQETLEFCRKAEEMARVLGNEESLLDATDIRMELESRDKNTEEVLQSFDELESKYEDTASPAIQGRIHLMRARFLFERQLYDQSLKKAEEAAKKYGAVESLDVGILKIRLLIRMRQRNEAVKIGMKFLRNTPMGASDRAELLFQLGYVCYQDRETNQASDFFSKACLAFEQSGNLRGLQKTLLLLGTVTYTKNDLRGAKKKYEDAAEISLKLGDVLGYCESLITLGGVNFDLIRFSGSLENYQHALSLLSNIGSPELFAKAHLALAYNYQYFGDVTEASNAIEKAMHLLRRSEDPYSVGLALRIQALIFQSANKIEEAYDLIVECIELVRGNLSQRQFALLQKVEFLQLLGKTTEALGDLERFQNEFGIDTRSQHVHLRYLQLQSQFQERKDPSFLKQIKEYLDLTATYALEVPRLPVLVEALEYEFNQEILEEALGSASKIRNALPDQYRSAFNQKTYVTRLRELATTIRA